MKMKTKNKTKNKTSLDKSTRNLQTILLVISILILIIMFIYVIPDNKSEGFRSLLLRKKIEDISDQKNDNGEKIKEFKVLQKPFDIIINQEFPKRYSYDLEFEYMDNYYDMRLGDILKISSSNSNNQKYIYGILNQKKQKNCINILTYTLPEFQKEENLNVVIVGNKDNTFIYKIKNKKETLEPGCYQKLTNCPRGSQGIINNSEWMLDKWGMNPNNYNGKPNYPGNDKEMCIKDRSYNLQHWCQRPVLGRNENPKSKIPYIDVVNNPDESTATVTDNLGREITVEKKFVPGIDVLNPNLKYDGKKIINFKRITYNNIIGLKPDDYNNLNEKDNLKILNIENDSIYSYGTIFSKNLTDNNNLSIQINADNQKLNLLNNNNLILIQKLESDKIVQNHIRKQSEIITDKSVIDSQLNQVNNRLSKLLKRFNRLLE